MVPNLYRMSICCFLLRIFNFLRLICKTYSLRFTIILSPYIWYTITSRRGFEGSSVLFSPLLVNILSRTVVLFSFGFQVLLV